MTALERLQMGRARIAAGHWCKGTLVRGTDRCLIGSMYQDDEILSVMNVQGGSPLSFDELQAMPHYQEVMAVVNQIEAMEELREAAGCGVAFWNDQNERTPAEVIALFDSAILAEEWRLLQQQEAAAVVEVPVAMAGSIVA